MKYGEFLQKNGTIGFVAPSFGCNTDPYKTAFEHALRRFKRQGYRLDLGPNCYAGSGVGISNTPELCGRELTEYYRKEENDCLIACGGGELMCEILDYVDWEKIKKAQPKWYMGFSDNTNMTYLLATICDTASIYGPCAPSFGMERQHKAIREAFAILTGTGAGWCEAGNADAPQARNTAENAGRYPAYTVYGYPSWEIEGKKDADNPLAGYNLTRRKVLKLYDGSESGCAATGCEGADRKASDQSMGQLTRVNAANEGSISEGSSSSGKYPVLSGRKIPGTVFSGRLLGGCLDCLVNLLGTCYDRTGEFLEKYQQDGIIWFLDACDLNVFGIRRAMWQMEHAGWFRYVKGFLVGRPMSALESMMNLDQYQAVLEVAGRKGVPVVMDADLGHLPPSMPLITGSYATVCVKGNEIRVEMELRP